MEKEKSLQIDLLKALAIVSVIILHSINEQSALNKFLIPFFIFQAVPIFMILMGYNNSFSYVKRGINTLRGGYNWFILKKRFNRIIWAYIFTILIEFLINAIFLHSFQVGKWILIFLTGGIGPGSYFVPLMIQVLLFLPIFYAGACKSPRNMLLYSFILNVAFEVFSYYSGMPNSVYRLLFPRYLFAVSLGVWLATNKELNWFFVTIGSFASLVYITSVHYFGFRLPVQPDWLSQNAPSFLWPLVIVLFGLK